MCQSKQFMHAIEVFRMGFWKEQYGSKWKKTNPGKPVRVTLQVLVLCACNP